MKHLSLILLGIFLAGCSKNPIQLGFGSLGTPKVGILWGQSNADDPVFAANMQAELSSATGCPWRIIIVAHGGTNSTQWATNYNGMLDELRLAVATYKPDAIFAVQGEGDGDKTAVQYATNLRIIIAAARAAGKESMLWSEALCHFQGYDYADVRGGQQMLWHDPGVIPGPDADSFRRPEWTHDSGLHFNTVGFVYLAKAWAQLVAPYFK